MAPPPGFNPTPPSPADPTALPKQKGLTPFRYPGQWNAQSGAASDPWVSRAQFHSAPVPYAASAPVSGGVVGRGPALCEIGHQGLYHDELPGGTLVYNRARVLHPGLGRGMQIEPLGYIDGMSLYAYVKTNSTRWADPSGLAVVAAGGVAGVGGVGGGIGVAVGGVATGAGVVAAGYGLGKAIESTGIGEAIGESLAGLLFAESGRNFVTEEAKRISRRTGQNPCAVLDALLAAAKACAKSDRDNNYIKAIEQAQKFLGCRNKQKRGLRR